MRSLFVFLFFIGLLSYIQTAEKFTATHMHQMYKPSGYLLSLDKNYVIYSVSKWDKTDGKKTNHLQYKEINSANPPIDLTEPVKGQSDSNPVMSSAFPNYVLFSRGGAIYYIDFPKKEGSMPVKLTDYPIPINDFKVKGNTLVFSAEVYFSCNTLNCTKEQNDEADSHLYGVYDHIEMFHWDHWVTEGKGNHMFYQEINYNKQLNKLEIVDEPLDLTKGMQVNAPPFDGGSESYDISNDGTMVAFTAHDRATEAISTTWKVYYYNLQMMNQPLLIHTKTEGRSNFPRFNKDDTKIGFLTMAIPRLESETFYLSVYNLLTNKVEQVVNLIDKSINSFSWYKDNEIIFVTLKIQADRIFHLNFKDPANPVYTEITKDDSVSYSSLVSVVYNTKENYLISNKVGYYLPEQLIKMDISTGKELTILDLNADLTKQHELVKQQRFSFTGAHGDIVYGSIFKPINYQEGKIYPGAFLVHGGPESSWSSGWSFRWNPQLFANEGYVVITIDPHGSTGYSSDFRNKIRNDWGGAPYEDLMIGIDYIKENFKYVNTSNLCAAGASYGGYMMNWMLGHNEIFKCIVIHDGNFDLPHNHYATDDLFFPQTENCPQDKVPCNPFDGEEIRAGFERNNPERYVGKWKTPTLVIHGGRDMRLLLTNGLSTFTALQLRGVESKFIYFPMENHWVLRPENSIKWYEQVLDWMNTHIDKQ